MNRFFATKSLFAAVLATAALGAATVAEARPEVILSIGLPGVPGWVAPSRGYAYPQPVYVRPPVFVSPREVYERRGWRGDNARFEWERERAWRHGGWRDHDRREGVRGGDGGHDQRHRDHRD